MMDYAEGLKAAIAIAEVHEEQAEAFSAKLAASPNANPGAALEWEHRATEAEAIARDLRHVSSANPTQPHAVTDAERESLTLRQIANLAQNRRWYIPELGSRYILDSGDDVEGGRLVARFDLEIETEAACEAVNALPRLLDALDARDAELAALRAPTADLQALYAAASPLPWVRHDEPEFAGLFSGESGPHIASMSHADVALVLALVNGGGELLAENARLRAAYKRWSANGGCPCDCSACDGLVEVFETPLKGTTDGR